MGSVHSLVLQILRLESLKAPMMPSIVSAGLLCSEAGAQEHAVCCCKLTEVLSAVLEVEHEPVTGVGGAHVHLKVELRTASCLSWWEPGSRKAAGYASMLTGMANSSSPEPPKDGSSQCQKTTTLRAGAG